MTGQFSPVRRHPVGYARMFLFVGLTVHGAMLLSLHVPFLNPLFDDATHRTGRGADFYAVYQAAHNFQDGISIYEKKTARQVVPYFFPYRYHPIVALTLGQVFSLLPPLAAYGIWIILLEVLLFINIVLSRRIFAEEPAANIATGFWLMFSPYFLELYMGQFSFLMATLLFWMFLATMKRRTKLVDSLWIGSLLMKSSSALFVPVFLKIKQWRTVLISGVLVIVLGLPYFVSMPGSLEAFAANFIEPLTMPTLAGNQGLAALVGVLILRLGGSWPGSIYDIPDHLAILNDALVVPTIVLTAAVVLFTTFITVKASPGHALELFFLWITAYFLFYKHVWEHHYVMMLPVFVLLYHRMKTGEIALARWMFWSSVVIIALPTVFVFIDKASGLNDPEFYWSTVESFLFHAPKPLAALALYSALSVALWKARSGKQSESE